MRTAFLCLAAFLFASNADAHAQLDSVRSFLNQHCVSCHSGDDPEGGFELRKLTLDGADSNNLATWVKLLDRVHSGDMPPPEEDQPSDKVRSQFVRELKRRLLAANRKRYAETGRTTVRRLNRFEYERTVQQLLGITDPLAHLLPEDTPLHGFDTVSDALRFSSLHIDKYLAAADAAVHAALRFTAEPKRMKERFEYSKQEGISRNANMPNAVVMNMGYGAVLFSDSSYISKIHGLKIDHGGMYRIRARGKAYQSERPVVLRLHAGDYKAGTVRMLGFFDMPPDKSREVEVTTRLEWNNYLYPTPDDLQADPNNKGVWNVGALNYRGSGLLVEWVEIEGPLFDQWPPKSVATLLGDTPIVELEHKQWINEETVTLEPKPEDPEASIRRLLPDFAERAFRRPLKAGEADRFIRLALETLQKGRSFKDAMRIGAKAILTSPQFLILAEKPGQLDGYALAARLSYTLWGTMPDDELMKLAADGKLTRANVLREQTDRLLNDDRSKAFVESFVGQWLDLRSIDNTAPDKRLYPEFDEILKLSMIAESEGFFLELLKNNLPVRNFVDSDFSVLTRRLATHYGIEGVQGQEPHRVELPSGSERGGLLTQAAILKVTANGTVTSPVSRGSWVLSRLLNQPPSPPPPTVGSIEPDTRGATTVREQLAKHRNDATCNSCHAKIDPPGFAMEAFDVIGGSRFRYRSKEEGERVRYKLNGRQIWEYKIGPVVDTAGQMETGERFTDIRDFKRLLMMQQDDVARSVASNLIVYATGHQIEIADRETVDRILADTKDTEHGLRSIVHAVIQSDLFRNK